MSGQTTTVACPNGHPSANRVICTVCGCQLAVSIRPGIDTAPTTAIPIAPVFAPQAPRLPKAPNSPPPLLAPLLRSGEAGPDVPDVVDVRSTLVERHLPDPRDIPSAPAPRSYDNHAPDAGRGLPGQPGLLGVNGHGTEAAPTAGDLPGASGTGNGHLRHLADGGPESPSRHDISEMRDVRGAGDDPPPPPAEAPSAPDAASSSSSSASSAAPPFALDDNCPHCSAEIDPLARFCEVCGYDPSTGSLPSANAPVIRPAPPVAALSLPAAPPLRLPPFEDEDEDEDEIEVSQPTNSSAPAWSAALAPPERPAGTWTAVITADRPYYEGQQVEGVDFPLGVPPRTIELPEGPVAIGRHSRSRGTHPAIDLSGPPEDPAVSHTHASLLPSDEGWKLVDHGSTNGTYLNESGDPVPANQPLTVKPGDRVYVGCWTRITLALVPPP
jgi:hypothetical protein